MKKQLIRSVALILGAAIMFSCQQVEQPAMDGAKEARATRAFGDKTPKLVGYIEINDTNPLNAGDYSLTNGQAMYDIVELFAANIRKRTVAGIVEPTLFFNDKMTNIFENNGYTTYIAPLQARGIKVLVTILGDHQGIGLSSMNSAQTTQFAKILAHVVEKYGLDGVGFDDEYADDYGSTNTTSYSEIIIKLRALLPAGKIISVFDWGGTGNINTEARACIDYGYPGSFSAYTFASPGMSLAKSNWSPMALNLGDTYNTSLLNQVNINSIKAFDQNYGAIMTFNMRRSSNRDPLNVFKKIADGAWDTSVTRNGGDRAQTWTFVPNGFYTTMDDVQ